MLPHFGKFKILGALAFLLVISFVLWRRNQPSNQSTLDASASPLTSIGITKKVIDPTSTSATIRTVTIIECGMVPTYSVNELTVYADVIVIGKVEKLDRVINLDRDTSFRQASIHYLSLGQLYQVKIDTVLKGEEPETSFAFAQHEGYLHKQQYSEEPSVEDIELARKNASCYRSFDESHRYLLFLDSKVGLDYLLPLDREPWRFDVTDELYVVPDSVASGNILPGPLAVLLQQIEAAMNPTPEATFLSPLSPLSPLATLIPR